MHFLLILMLLFTTCTCSRTCHNAGSASNYRAQYRKPEKMKIPLGATFVIEEEFIPHTSSNPAISPAAAVVAMEI